MVDDLRRALGFLTVYRLRATDTWSPELFGSAMAYYPLVGAGIGCALWCLYILLAYAFPPPVTAALLLTGLCLVTGGIHLSGLAVTMEGLSGGHDRQTTLGILKEQRPGTMGSLTVVLGLLIKFACLSAIPDEGMLMALVLLGTLSRYAMVQMACFSAYARPGGGFGEPFVRGARRDHFTATLPWSLIIVVCFGGVGGVLIGTLVSVATFGLQTYFRRRLGGITADVLGATNEMGETLVLVLAAMMYYA
jgi:adenosylcobinamide-GDP ribazoletransferase